MNLESCYEEFLSSDRPTGDVIRNKDIFVVNIGENLRGKRFEFYTERR